MRTKLKCFQVGYWHSSSEYYPCGYVIAKNEKEAIRRLLVQVQPDGLGDVSAKEIISLLEVVPKEVLDFFGYKEVRINDLG